MRQRRATPRLLFLSLLACLPAPVRAQTGDQAVYTDSLQNGWQSYGWATLDYGNPERLRLKLDAYLANARRLGLIGTQTIVVLPEHLGTPLALMGEKPEVYAAARSEDAIQWLLLGNPLRVARAWFQAQGDRRLADSLLRMKAWDMASAYQQLFGGLARQYGVTLVAGSIVMVGAVMDLVHAEGEAK